MWVPLGGYVYCNWQTSLISFKCVTEYARIFRNLIVQFARYVSAMPLPQPDSFG